MSTSATRNPPSIEIDLKKCTGCGICVEFCSPRVLGIISGHAEVVGRDKCKVCRLCELLCAELAIIIKEGGK